MGNRAIGIVALLAGCTVTSVALGGCSQQGLALARQACDHVDRSIRLYETSQRSTATSSATDAAQAYDQLRLALPLAAQATSADGQWNALMTTISESARVDEGHLLIALQAQCAAAESNQPGIPPEPTTTPPAEPPSTTPATTPQNGT